MCSLLRVAVLITALVMSANAKIAGWDSSPNAQYHIQTDEGPERFFKYQTISGQYRKEKRLADGTVVGSYGWVDPNGFLRLRDYIADDKGYRIVRTKMVHVGVETPIGSAVSAAKKVPSQGGVGVQNAQIYQKPYVPPTPAPISLRDYLQQKEYYPSSTPPPYQPVVAITPNGYPSTTPAPVPAYSPQAYPDTTPAPYYTSTPSPIRPQTFRPYYNPNSVDPYSDRRVYDNVGAAHYATPQQQFPLYDGVSMTHNGFRYYLPRQYHEEENLAGDKRAGSFGYIDPFGIRRVIYYNTSPGSGFVHRKNNRYVGFEATPYDPRF